MSDLLDPLRGLAQEPTRPLPPSEVRRRGDRQRRRRTAAAMAGAACTVAVVAFGAVTIAQNASTNSSRELPPATQPPEPTPTPTPAAPVTPVTRIPAGFPVDEGMAQAEEVEGPSRTTLFLADASICGAVSYATDHEPVDAVGVSHHGLEYSRSRELRVHPDVRTARQAVDELVGTFRGCPRYATDTGDTGTGEALNDVSARELGDEAWVVKNGYLFDGEPMIGQDIWAVVRVGTAILVSRSSSEGPGMTDAAAFEESATAELATLGRTVDAMCVFTDSGC